MHIIPVIDVRHGIPVRAVAGDRANYQPLVTPLAPAGGATDWGQTHGSDPDGTGQGNPTVETVARGYRRLYPFSTMYIADLDAIEGRGANSSLVPALAVALPAVEFWVDAGCITESETGGVTVIGSEVLPDGQVGRPIPDSTVLSLDFRGDEFMGPPALLRRPDFWPKRVIVMTLGRVGSGGGPDFQRIAQISRLAPRAHVYAAGGVRDIADLHAARAAGAHGALIASALHGQKIKADDLQEIIGL